MGKAREAAQEYFRCVRDSDGPGMQQLFAHDALLSTSDEMRRGGPDIRAFYESRAMGTGVKAYPQVPTIEQGNRCAVEIIVHHPDGEMLRVVDLFTVDDAGRITSLHIYRGLLQEGDDTPRGSPFELPAERENV